MSIETIKAVLDHSRARGAARMVLFVLAECANKDGRCWPSVRTIARRCACAKSTVHLALGQLKDAGEIRVEEGRPGKVVVYQLTVTAQAPHPSEARTPHPSDARAPQDPPPRRGSDGAPRSMERAPPKIGPEP